MRTVAYSIDIDRPVDVVYDYSIDPGRFSEWIPNDEAEVIIDGDSLTIGSTYTVQQGKQGKSRRALIYEILALEPTVLVTEKTSGRLLTYTLHRTFSEENGKTTVSEVIEMEDPPGLAKLLAGFMLGRVKKLHQQSLQRLKNALEQT